MSKSGKFKKRSGVRRQIRIRETKGATPKGRDIIRRDEHRKIAPKHPNMGRK